MLAFICVVMLSVALHHLSSIYFFNLAQDIMERVCPGKKLYIQVIAARVRMDMKVAFGEVKETLKKITAAKKGRKKK